MAAIFRMKGFEIQQSRSALRVGTDGVLLGAYVAAHASPARRVLDIGTGTGVVALMVAQAMPMAHVDGVELDAPSALEAADNAARSPFADRVLVHHADICSYAQVCSCRYDLIVSNPPFYTPTHYTADERSTVAKHSAELSASRLMDAIRGVLAPDGQAVLIVAASACVDFAMAAAESGLSVREVVYVHTVAHKAPKRMILWLIPEKEVHSCSIQHLTINLSTTRTHHYTEAYSQLMQPYLTIFE